ncbi:hypothetical protein ACIQXI_08185 [Lysinibacillus sp. NPDC097195]|uniref:WapI family immunity protein n=1 Tax=Lysinibacillus sp. NPDC097195 TaxID=3364141 RepID=UPI0037FC54D0
MKFHLIGEDNESVEIEVLTRSYPESTDYWDVNWVVSTINVNIPGYVVKFNADIRTDELQDFLDELNSIKSNLRGKAILKNLDNYINIECVINDKGHLFWTVRTCYPAGYGAVLHVDFKSDQSYLQKLTKELRDILTVFPVIGNP